MSINFLILYCALSFVNVVIQTVKSLCTVKCSTFVSACVNALAYGLYVYVIFFTNAEGLPLWGKAAITALANFTGVYIANMLFNRLFNREVKWKVEVSLPLRVANEFDSALRAKGLEYYCCGSTNDWVALAVFCPTVKDSKNLAAIMPREAKYNIVECVKRL